MDEELKKVVETVAESTSKKDKIIEEQFQMVVFVLDGEEYGVLITDLQEIIKKPEITPIPNSPDFINGILNLRGKIVVVIDLEKRFHLKREGEDLAEHVIILENHGNDFGIIVDEVIEVMNVPKSSIQTTSSLVTSKIQANYLKGIVVIDRKNDKDPESDKEARLIILLDLPKMLEEKELLAMGETIKDSTE